jgi:TPR repeat protein
VFDVCAVNFSCQAVQLVQKKFSTSPTTPVCMDAPLKKPQKTVARYFAADDKDSLALFKAGDAAGHIASTYELANVYLFGLSGVEEDASTGVKYLIKAANAGHASAAADLGECCEEGFGISQCDTAALSWHERAANGGSMRGITNLANCYLDGTLGTVQNTSKAEMLYRKALLAFHEVGSLH